MFTAAYPRHACAHALLFLHVFTITTKAVLSTSTTVISTERERTIHAYFCTDAAWHRVEAGTLHAAREREMPRAARCRRAPIPPLLFGSTLALIVLTASANSGGCRGARSVAGASPSLPLGQAATSSLLLPVMGAGAMQRAMGHRIGWMPQRLGAETLCMPREHLGHPRLRDQPAQTVVFLSKSPCHG